MSAAAMRQHLREATAESGIWETLAGEAMRDAYEWKARAREAEAALAAMLREHDALVMATGGTGDRWPAATRARAALAKVSK